MTSTTNDGEKQATGRRMGYALIPPENRDDGTQADTLHSAGCNRIFQDVGSPSASRPVMTRLLGELVAGDMLIVVSLDRIARSLDHLIELLDDLQRRGVHFRSLDDKFDTSTPEGPIAHQTFRIVARLEKTLSSERSRAGIKAAKAQGRMPGNPGLREKRPDAIAAVSKARDKHYLDELTASAHSWLPVVQELRPHHSWDNVVLVLNRRGQDWTVERLRRAAHRMVRAQRADPEIIARSPRRPPSDHLMKVVAAISIAHPGLSLRGIAAELEKMGERPARGGGKWQASSVRHLLDEAFRFGLIPR